MCVDWDHSRNGDEYQRNEQALETKHDRGTKQNKKRTKSGRKKRVGRDEGNEGRKGTVLLVPSPSYTVFEWQCT